jgi:signal transduction histidine kinase
MTPMGLYDNFESVGDKPIRIYVADDDELILDLMHHDLTKKGWLVETFFSGEQLLARQEEEPCEIVITDIRMGGMSGLELLEKIREKWPASEVILISGYATVENAVEALRQGAYDLLTKPIERHQVSAVLHRCATRIRYARENRELRRVVERLVELNRQKEKFLALTNHELRTPTTVMVGMLKLLERHSDKLDDETLNLVRGASQAASHLADAVKDLGMLASIRDGDIALNPFNCKLGDICSSINALVGDYRVLRSLKIKVECPQDSGIEVCVDKKKTIRAAAALIQNAVKFTPDGGEIDVAVRLDSGNVAITVADTGLGVPEGEEEHIFQLFYSAEDENLHHSSDYEFGGRGMGVGLAMVRAIAEAHGGTISFAHRESGGSLFTLAIPAIPAIPG